MFNPIDLIRIEVTEISKREQFVRFKVAVLGAVSVTDIASEYRLDLGASLELKLHSPELLVRITPQNIKRTRVHFRLITERPLEFVLSEGNLATIQLN